MKKKSIIFAAAFCVALTACVGQTARESASPATAVPTVAVTAAQTMDPTAVPTTVVTAEPSPIHTAEPISTPALTAAPTPRPTPAASVKPGVEPTAPVVETPALEVTPPPSESTALPPEPTESLCGLPLAPTPTPEGSMPPAASDTPMPSESQEPTTQPSQTPGPEAPPVTPEPVRPTDEEVLAAYHDAAEAYGWFAGYLEPELDVADQITLSVAERGGELTLYRVTRPGLSSLDELRVYLKSLFSDEVVDDLFKNGSATFADGPEGGLYTTGAGRGSDVTKGTVTLTVEWNGEESLPGCTVKATVQLLTWDGNGGSPTVSGEQAYEFPYQKVGDKWVFTQFESIF